MNLKDQLKSAIPQDLFNKMYHLPQSVAANLYHGNPSHDLNIIGVTGTNGKTTTSTGVYHLLQTAKIESALISTVAAYIAGKELDTGFHVTTPNSWQLQALLKRIKQKDIPNVVLETTSHGFAQYRLYGINFNIGIITNVTHEHLDYHKTFENYLNAKAQLFNNVEHAILNADDQSYQLLLQYIKKHNPKAKVYTYGINNRANIQASKIKPTKTGISFQVKTDLTQLARIYEIPMIGNYNVSNAMAVILAGYIMKIPAKQIQKAISTYPSIPGRMQIVPHKHLKIVVDFAHTPDALDVALKSIKLHFGTKKSKLISVFGCAGLRDATKRPMMGSIATTHADITILTAEDPRTENVNEIIDQIASGISKAKETSIPNLLKYPTPKEPVYVRVPDRQDAINLAVEISKKDDIIGIFGKGHEQSMCFGTTEYPWSDIKAVQKALK